MYAAILVGAAWPCTETRGAEFTPRRCVCGYESKEGPLPVHFCFGSVGISDPCTEAMDTRGKWHERVLDIFNEAGEDAEGASDPSYEKLALWLGGREGMKKKMVVDLAVAFIETFGEWAAKERDAKIGKCFPKATTEDIEQVEYDETEIEGLNATMAGKEFIDEGVKWRVHNIEFDAEHEEPVCFYYDVRINRAATKHDCQYSTIGEVNDWIAAYERRLARRAARTARGGVDSETDESDDGL